MNPSAKGMQSEIIFSRRAFPQASLPPETLELPGRVLLRQPLLQVLVVPLVFSRGIAQSKKSGDLQDPADR